MKRLLDILLSLTGLIVTSPVLVGFIIAIYVEDRHSPFYVAPRVGKGFRNFRMVKLRSMSVGGAGGPSSTSKDDHRITRVGSLVRKYKLDELTQLINVLIGDMSLVGPRPNVPSEVALYTAEERELLSVRPGITDFASIVFSDEGEILEGSADPDLDYNQLIRPWKSRLGLFYLSVRSLTLDIRLILLTALSIFSREQSLKETTSLVERLGADPDVVEICRRERTLEPTPPPGADEIVSAI